MFLSPPGPSAWTEVENNGIDSTTSAAASERFILDLLVCTSCLVPEKIANLRILL
jgi:hypothetical protein